MVSLEELANAYRIAVEVAGHPSEDRSDNAMMREIGSLLLEAVRPVPPELRERALIGAFGDESFPAADVSFLAADMDELFGRPWTDELFGYKERGMAEVEVSTEVKVSKSETHTITLIEVPGLEVPAVPADIASDILAGLDRISIDQGEVELAAQKKWREYGCPEGKDAQIWREAEELVRDYKENEVLTKVAAKHKKPVAEVKDIRASIGGKKPKKPSADGKFSCWDLVDSVVGNCGRVLLWGVSGTGKSWAARRNNLDGKPVFSVSLTDDTPAAELRGHYGIVDGSYKWLDGPCILAWRQGVRCVLNELEKASGDAQTFLLGFLDDIEIAQQTLPNNETVMPKKGFHVVATMNGHPDQDLLPALRDRFPVCIHIDEVAPPALAKLPPQIRAIAKNSGIIAAVQRRISIRSWNEFESLRKQVGDEVAAACIFGDRAKTVMDHLKVAESK